jgi:hypothetical protein
MRRNLISKEMQPQLWAYLADDSKQIVGGVSRPANLHLGLE